MVTTIQLNENVKKELDRLKSHKETYEDVIVNMISKISSDKENLNQLLKEEAIEMAGENLRIAREWEGTLMDGLDKNERWEKS